MEWKASKECPMFPIKIQSYSHHLTEKVSGSKTVIYFYIATRD